MQVSQGGRKGVDKLISLYGVWFQKVIVGENMPMPISIPTPTWLRIIKENSSMNGFRHVQISLMFFWFLGHTGS